MQNPIISISTSASLNQAMPAAICAVEAQYAGADNKFVINVVQGAPFVADKTIQSFLDQFGNVNLMLPHPVVPQHLWVSMTWMEFQNMFLALLSAVEFKNAKDKARLQETLAA